MSHGGYRPGAGRPRVSDEVKRLRGTFRPDRAQTPVVAEAPSHSETEASESYHVIGDSFWFGNPKIRYSLVNGRVWREGDPGYDSCRQDADGGVTYLLEAR